MIIHNFERLNAWKFARELTLTIYTATSNFPIEEKFGLTNQMRRAAISVSSNIAEGAGRTSPNDQKHFYTIAYGSLTELLSQAIIACDLEFITTDILIDIRLQIDRLARVLSGLSASTTKNPDQADKKTPNTKQP